MNYHVFDQMIEGVSVIDRNWACIYANKVFQNHCKKTEDAIVGSNIINVFPGFEETLHELLEACMEKRTPTKKVNLYTAPGGEATWTYVRMHPIEEGVLLMTFDITEQKQLEEEIKKANKLLESRVRKRTHELSRSLQREKELNRMKTTFVSMASHELKTPLTAILSSASLIEKHLENNSIDKTKRHLERVKSSVKNMEGLLNDFLSLDQLQQGVIKTTNEEFSLQALLVDIEEELLVRYKNKQSVKHTINGVDCVVLDRHILRHILSNLISNGLKYSEEEVEVTVSVSDFLEITVVDKGVGIPEEERESIFSQFFRAKNASNFEGTGLGLNIVKHYVDLLNGEISFESEQGKGTTFKVTLKNEA